MPSQKKQILHPGIHGGKWYIDKHGMVQYGEPPVGHVPHPSMDEHHVPGQHHDFAQVLQNIKVPDDPSDYVGFQNAYWWLTGQLHKHSASDISDEHKSQLKAHFAKVQSDWKEKLDPPDKSLGPAELKQIAKNVKLDGYQWGNKQTLLTALTGSDFDELKANADLLKQKKAEHYAKHGGTEGYQKSKAVKEGKKLVEAAMKLPGLQQPKPSYAEISIPGSEGGYKAEPIAGEDEESFEIDADDKPAGLVFQKDAKHLGGAHTKSIWQDNTGKQWLFKPNAEKFRGFAEEMAANVAKLVGTATPKVFQADLGGKSGSLQELLAKKGDGYNHDQDGIGDPSFLSPKQLEDLGREQVVDWLIGNYDSHHNNFIIRDGKIIGIDKGQAFKFLGADSANPSPDFQPNAAYGSLTIYKTLWDKWKKGELPASSATVGLQKGLEAIEKVPDATYRALLKPYMDARFGEKPSAKKEEAYKLALARKTGARAGFEKMLGDISGQPFEFPSKLTPTQPSSGTFAPHNAAAIESAAFGPHGCSISIDSIHIEDQNVLVYGERAGAGKPQTALKMKLTQHANDILLSKLKSAGVENLPPQAGKEHIKGQALPEDKHWGAILSAIKTINHHASDGDYNETTLKEFSETMNELYKLSENPEAPPNVKEMAEHYKKIDNHLAVAKAGKTKVGGGKHEQYVASSNWSPKQDEPEPPSKAGKLKVTYNGPMRWFGGGVSDDGHVHYKAAGSAPWSMVGTKQYEADLGDGVSLTFRPYTTAETTYAHQEEGYASKGGVELRVAGKPVGEESVALALKKLSELGVHGHESSAEDRELLYLHQYAYARGLTTAASYPLKKTADWEEPGAFAKLKNHLSDTLGEDITKTDGYDPAGFYETAKGEAIGGRRRFKRPDITDEVLTKGALKDVVLVHNSSANLPELLESVLSTGGLFMPTTEKLRVGIQPKGMSPSSDMSTGGASYFFTRLRKKSTTGGTFVFSNKLLQRMDGISYSSDHFGKVTSEKYVAGNRAKSVDAIKDIASSGGSSNNETIFKEGVSLLDYCQQIRCKNASERNVILALFAKHGVSQIGGLPIDKAVTSPKK